MQALKTTTATIGNFISNLGVSQVGCLTGIILNQASQAITGSNFLGVITQPGLKKLEELRSVARIYFYGMTNVDLLKEIVINNKKLFGSVAVMTVVALGVYVLANKINNPPLTQV